MVPGESSGAVGVTAGDSLVSIRQPLSGQVLFSNNNIVLLYMFNTISYFN